MGKRPHGAKLAKARTTRDPLLRETGSHSKSRLVQVLAAHCRTRFSAALHTELPIDAADLRFDSVDGDDQRFSKPGEGMKLALLGKGCPRYQHQDLQFTASPSLFVRLHLPAFEQMEGLLGLSLCDEQAGDNEVFVLLVQSWQALPLRSARRGPALCRCQISCRKCEAGLYRLDAPLEQRPVGRRLPWQPSKPPTEP